MSFSFAECRSSNPNGDMRKTISIRYCLHLQSVEYNPNGDGKKP